MKESLKKRLLDYKDQAFVSRMLAEINQNVPIEFDMKKCHWGNYDKGEVIQLFKNYGFKTLIDRLLNNVLEEEQPQ